METDTSEDDYFIELDRRELDLRAYVSSRHPSVSYAICGPIKSPGYPRMILSDDGDKALYYFDSTSSVALVYDRQEAELEKTITFMARHDAMKKHGTITLRKWCWNFYPEIKVKLTDDEFYLNVLNYIQLAFPVKKPDPHFAPLLQTASDYRSYFGGGVMPSRNILPPLLPIGPPFYTYTGLDSKDTPEQLLAKIKAFVEDNYRNKL